MIIYISLPSVFNMTQEGSMIFKNTNKKML